MDYKRFWAEALETATYLRNRSPAKSLDQMTLFEAWTGRRPDIRHLTDVLRMPEMREENWIQKPGPAGWWGTETLPKDIVSDSTHSFLQPRRHMWWRGVPTSRKFEHQGGWGRVEDERVSGGEENEKPQSEATRYPQRIRAEPEWYGERVNYISEDPGSLTEALSSPKSEEWPLSTNKVWTLTDLPKGKKAVGETNRMDMRWREGKAKCVSSTKVFTG